MMQASRAGGAGCYLGHGEPVSEVIETGLWSWGAGFSWVYKCMTFCLSWQTLP